MQSSWVWVRRIAIGIGAEVIVSLMGAAFTPNAWAAEDIEPAAARLERVADAPEGAATLVFIPGLGSSPETWRSTIDPFSDRYGVGLVSIAGFAGQPATPTRPLTDAAAQAVAKALETQDLEDVVLVGHSLGGQIAILAALAAPDLVSGVVTADTLPFLAQMFNPAATPETARGQGQAMATALSNQPREAFLSQLRAGYGVQSFDVRFHDVLAQWAADSDQSSFAAAMGETLARDLRPDLAKLAAPLLAMPAWGQGAPFTADQIEGFFARQYAAAPDIQVKVIENSRHFIMVDQAEAIGDAIARFLNGLED
ncbi:MAG: alpha/beta fold hydrolase [Maricaulaceae bacterium]